MAKIRIFAAPGRRVLDPTHNRQIPTEGIEVDDTDVFWHRKRMVGDCLPGLEDEALAAAPAAPAADPAPATKRSGKDS